MRAGRYIDLSTSPSYEGRIASSILHESSRITPAMAQSPFWILVQSSDDSFDEKVGGKKPDDGLRLVLVLLCLLLVTFVFILIILYWRYSITASRSRTPQIILGDYIESREAYVHWLFVSWNISILWRISLRLSRFIRHVVAGSQHKAHIIINEIYNQIVQRRILDWRMNCNDAGGKRLISSCLLCAIWHSKRAVSFTTLLSSLMYPLIEMEKRSYQVWNVTMSNDPFWRCSYFAVLM